MEASAIHARAGLRRGRVTLGAPLLRLRSDQQLVGLFRGGNDDAFRVIHDRYRARLLAYVGQMLAGPHPDAEDILQDVFVRAYGGLRANGRDLRLRPWLYRVAHNRCVDELRRPTATAAEPLELGPAVTSDPVLECEQRESLSRLITDIRRLPHQQRSALLMREMGGMAYSDIADALTLSVPAVKSLLVRARIGLAAAVEARDTACQQIRTELTEAHDRGVRASGLARRHLHDCSGCREYRAELRSVSRQLAALTPVLGPVGVLVRMLGAGGGAGGGAAAGGTGSGVIAAGGAAGAGTTVLGAAATHVAAVVAAAVVTAGGAVEIQRTVATQLDPPPAHHAKRLATPGQGTSVEATTAVVAAPASSYAPARVQQTSAPAGAVPQNHAARQTHSRRAAKKGKSATASRHVAPPSAAAADPEASSSTQATPNANAPEDDASSCRVPPTPVQPAVTSATGTAVCPPSTATDPSGAPASTSPATSPGSSSPSTSGASGAAGSSSPTPGSASASTATAANQAQST